MVGNCYTLKIRGIKIQLLQRDEIQFHRKNMAFCLAVGKRPISDLFDQIAMPVIKECYICYWPMMWLVESQSQLIKRILKKKHSKWINLQYSSSSTTTWLHHQLSLYLSLYLYLRSIHISPLKKIVSRRFETKSFLPSCHWQTIWAHPIAGWWPSCPGTARCQSA